MARPDRRAAARAGRAIVLTNPAGELPGWMERAVGAAGLESAEVHHVDRVLDEVRRARPAVVVLDGRGGWLPHVRDALVRIKADAFTGVVPCVAVVDGDRSGVAELLNAGADEALTADAGEEEAVARIVATVRRSVRDLAAQPTTRLPAAGVIEREIDRRIAAGVPFAACYADLDHFKEFNDRYGYHEGDRVIRMVARILHDAAVGTAGPDAFVGHVGGDDFMLVLPLDRALEVCTLALDVFDLFVPFQYSEADRRVGYYFGKDRRGQLHRVPLMTLSIGVATTERRRFRSAAEVSKLASEMKSFAKAKPGSLFAVDRRSEGPSEPSSGRPQTAASPPAPQTSGT